MSCPAIRQLAQDGQQHQEQTSSQEPLVDTNKYYCPFLERGFCKNSTRCNFSHSSHGSIKVPTNYCHFFLANQCFYGLDCKFRHSEPNDDDVVASLTQQLGQLSHDLNNTSGCSSGGASGGLGTSSNNEPPLGLRIQLVQDGRYKWVVDEGADYGQEDDEDEYVCDDENVGGNETSNATNNDDYETAHDEEEEEEEEEEDDDGDDKSSSTETPNEIMAKRKFVSSSILRSLPNTSSNSNKNASSDSNTTPNTTSATKITKAWQSKEATEEALGLSRTHEQDYPLCPYSLATGECPFPQGQCNYLHGLVCDLCCRSCLHPFNETQRLQHRDECLQEHEREMELSFAVQRSKDKVCGICMDTVVEKKPVTSSRFGILEKCNHTFCLDCIRKWRGTKQFDNRTIRACPECRVSSDFVVPSKYWIEDQEDKEKLIRDYKAALR